uniref:ATP synthase complex subunit 8 n=1 Tax=Pseudoniphargus grandis TaxID=2211498 RepID=A0A345UDQ1_9CRUS|nr:ATP synthase F0 subunit 8 [Pseudoniphargus grandis]
MPQMAPIVWLSLFFLFLSLTYFLMSYLFFFPPAVTANQASSSLPGPKFYWKW